jgi:hypothetical protein
VYDSVKAGADLQDHRRERLMISVGQSETGTPVAFSTVTDSDCRSRCPSSAGAVSPTAGREKTIPESMSTPTYSSAVARPPGGRLCVVVQAVLVALEMEATTLANCVIDAPGFVGVDEFCQRATARRPEQSAAAQT